MTCVLGAGDFAVKTWTGEGFIFGVSTAGTQETKKVRGNGRKIREGAGMSKAAQLSSSRPPYLALQRERKVRLIPT